METKLESVDISIENSLKRYGFAWIERENEFRFYYGIHIHDGGGDYIKFDWGYFKKDLDFWKEFPWMEQEDIESFLNSVQKNKEDFDNMPFPQKVYDLVSHYGYDEVFGTSYYAGMTYSEVIKDANEILWKD